MLLYLQVQYKNTDVCYQEKLSYQLYKTEFFGKECVIRSFIY